jgi:putative tricarboxylic transport membrane protein
MKLAAASKWCNENGLLGPSVTAVLALSVWCYLHFDYVPKFTQPGSMFGPGSWPEMAFGGLWICALLLVVSRIRDAKGNSSAMIVTSKAGRREPGATKVVVSGLLIVMYAIGISVIGFAFSTLAFLLTWIPLHGKRKPAFVVAVSVLGTVALLYIFAKFAYMPLPKGTGVFYDWTVSIYRWLGLFR